MLIPIQLTCWGEQFSNQKDQGKEYYNFLMIHQGPIDTIIFHIQNEHIGVDGEEFSVLFKWSLTLKQSKPLFFKNAGAGIKCHNNVILTIRKWYQVSQLMWSSPLAKRTQYKAK